MLTKIYKQLICSSIFTLMLSSCSISPEVEASLKRDIKTINAAVEKARMPSSSIINDTIDVKDDIEANSDEPPVEDWIAPEGSNLKDLLAEWADKSGWRLVWKTERNYELKAGAMFRGRFTDVSAAIVRAFARARPAPIATFV